MMDDEALEVLVSDDRMRRAEIHRRRDGTYPVILWREVTEDGEGAPSTYWSPERGPVIIADTPDRARTLARESLRASHDE